jgi:hypothetical protein
MQLPQRINYSRDLNARQKEVYNFHKVANFLADYGFNCIKLADDWQGADFLAYHKDGANTLKVQLKPRPGIAKKYCNKGLYIAFPMSGHWYLIEHDLLVEKVGQCTNWINTPSWTENGWYSSTGINKALRESLSESRLD